MIKTVGAILYFLVCILLLSCGDKQADWKVQGKVISHDSPQHKEILMHAKRWQSALLAGDLMSLINYAYPEQRIMASKQIRNKRSTLYQSLFTDELSAKEILSRSPLNIEIIYNKLPGKDNDAVIVVFYNTSRGDYKVPFDDIGEYVRLLNEGQLYELYMICINGKWYVIYDVNEAFA